MSARVSKEERQLNLYATLHDARRPMSIHEIQAKVHGYAYDPADPNDPERKVAFRRTFFRDKNDLERLGVEITTAPIPGTDPPAVGHQILPDSPFLPQLELEDDELAALHVAVTSVRFKGKLGVEALEALANLGGTPGEGSDLPVAVIPNTSALQDMYIAATEQRLAEFTYHGEQRELEAWTVKFEGGHWHVIGFDRLRKAQRRFRVDRIQGDVQLGSPGEFEPPAEPPETELPASWRIGEGPPITVRLQVDAEVAWMAAARLGSTAEAEPQPDGSTVFQVEVLNPLQFRNLALEFLDHAEILDPPELRQDMRIWLQSIAS